MSTQNLSISIGQQSQEGFLSQIISSVRNYLAASSAQAQLERLSDYELEDIGITRSQIPYVVRNNVDSYR